MNLYEPQDVMEAYGEWGCNCGPAALAAVLRIPCKAVRPLFPLYPDRAWCNPTGMMTALGLTRAQWRKCGKGEWPAYGLCFLQVEGPWENPGVPVGVAYRHTHWIALAFDRLRGNMAYDVNAGVAGLWLPMAVWADRVMNLIVQSNRRATGWRLRAAIEVTP